MSRVEKINMRGETNEKLPMVLFSSLVNRDSLARELNQKIMLSIDFLINNLSGSLYAALHRAIYKDQEVMNELQVIIESILKDIKLIQKEFFHKEL